MQPDAYSAYARWYDFLTIRALRPVREGLVAMLVEARVNRVLDIGCGTGVLAALLMEEGLDVTGIDASEAMLTQAIRHLPPEKALYATGASFPFSDASFDATVLSLVLHESSERPEALLAETLRIAPRCFVVEWRMPERNLDYLSRPLVHAIERMAGKRHYARFTRFIREGYLQGAAERAGAVILREQAFRAGSLVLAEVCFEP